MAEKKEKFRMEAEECEGRYCTSAETKQKLNSVSP